MLLSLVRNFQRKIWATSVLRNAKSLTNHLPQVGGSVAKTYFSFPSKGEKSSNINSKVSADEVYLYKYHVPLQVRTMGSGVACKRQCVNGTNQARDFVTRFNARHLCWALGERF